MKVDIYIITLWKGLFGWRVLRTDDTERSVD